MTSRREMETEKLKLSLVNEGDDLLEMVEQCKKVFKTEYVSS